MDENIKSVLIDELGTTNSEENKHIINQIDHAFLDEEIKNLKNRLRTRKILALICVALALLCTGVVGYNYYNIGMGLHVVILLFLSVILAATAGYEAIDMNKRVSIYKIIKELSE
ncbi:MAG TPA: hypothetical protein VKA34_23955 [Balneolales bacterium]|nr:hypothetical protein [Balneolales bacterium]